MDQLPFMKKLKQYEEERAANIDKKNSVIDDLQRKVDDQKRIIDDKQADYNSKPSSDLFQQLLGLKRELEGLKINVRSEAEIIQIPDIKTVDPNEVIEETKVAVEKLDFKKYRDNIFKAKDAYLNAIDAFVDKTQELRNLSNDLSSYDVGVSFKDLFKSSISINQYMYYVNDKSRFTELDIRNIEIKLAQAQNNVNNTFIRR